MNIHKLISFFTFSYLLFLKKNIKKKIILPVSQSCGLFHELELHVKQLEAHVYHNLEG